MPSSFHIKEIIYKIHTSKISENGGFCTFIPLDKNKGLKLYGNRSYAEKCYRTQNKFLKLNLAPKIYSSVFEIPYLFLEWNDDKYLEHLDHLKKFGYITQIAKTKFRKSKYDIQLNKIRRILKKKKMRLDDLVGENNRDIVWDNLGLINDKLVIIDFDPCTIYDM